MKNKILAAKIFTASTALLVTFSMPVHAGIPVIDGTNLAQTVISATEAVAQTSKQIMQYQTQLQQYENMLQNTAAPAAYIWNQAQATINNLVNATNTLNYYKTQLGSLDSYLSKYQNLAYYKSSPCFTSAGCSATDRNNIVANQERSSEAQKKANDAIFQSLDQQQNTIQSDASMLEDLQRKAQSATGQMQAIGYANQLASHQANQLMQIRSLLMVQQNAMATKMQVDADKEAQQQAAHALSAEGRGPTTLPTAKKW